MFLWIAFAFLTAAVLAAVLAPLARAARQDEPLESMDTGAVAVYRDQLQEIAADQTRGVLSAGEAEAAKLEVSRRLLASAARDERTAPPSRPLLESQARDHRAGHRRRHTPADARPLSRLRFAGNAIEPFAARTDAAVEQAALANSSPRWKRACASIPSRPGLGGDRARLFQARSLPRCRQRLRQRRAPEGRNRAAARGPFAEATVLAADGIVTEEARVAYEKILKLEPGRPEPRFWLALAKEQDGKLADALADYKALLAEAPADAPWRPALEHAHREVSRAATAATKAARALDPRRRRGRCRASSRPEQRSADDRPDGRGPGPAASRATAATSPAGCASSMPMPCLDRKDDARAALAEARRNFDGDAGALAELSKLATTPGARLMTRKQRRAAFIGLSVGILARRRLSRALCAARHHRLLPHAQGRGRRSTSRPASASASAALSPRAASSAAPARP